MHCEEMRNKNNPCVFMDLSIDGRPVGRIVIELFADLVPKIVENFRALCTGEMGTGKTTKKPLHYKGTVFYRIHQNIFAQGGDFENNDGTGGESIFGGTFKGDNYKQIRTRPGMLYMANSPERIDSKFYIVFGHLSIFECHYDVVGRVIEGMEIVKKIEELGTPQGTPTQAVEIINCGELPDDKKNNGMESDEGEKEKTGKRAISSDESFDGQVKKQRGSTAGYKEVPVM